MKKGKVTIAAKRNRKNKKTNGLRKSTPHLIKTKDDPQAILVKIMKICPFLKSLISEPSFLTTVFKDNTRPSKKSNDIIPNYSVKTQSPIEYKQHNKEI
ncbi:MAG: hypothetical protein ACETWM_08245 [Candidatus Lokiarchaeia archaeon]